MLALRSTHNNYVYTLLQQK